MTSRSARMRPLQWAAAGLILLVETLGVAHAQTRRALIVGINTNRPNEIELAARPAKPRGGWINLRGPLNDARAVAAVLSARYQFDEKNVVMLLDKDATHETILSTFRRVLIDQANSGDIGFFYYAVDGSQMRNSRSPEPDKLDESIVPSETELGVPDIRDKEVARLLAEAAKKGVRVTVILDSCHSGSMSCGISQFTRPRSMEPDTSRDANDPEPAPPVGNMGVLTFTATQDWKLADETLEKDNEWHGWFTSALLSVLRAAPVDEPAEKIFARVRALMRATGNQQEPALDANEERLAVPLFGAPTRGARGRPIVAVRRVDDGRTVLLGGPAIGLAPGATLVRRSPPARIEIVDVRELGQSTARLIVADGERPPEVRSGDLFELERWAARQGEAVRGYIGPTLADSKVREAAKALDTLRKSPSVVWIDDPSDLVPTHVAFFGVGEWKLRLPGGKEVSLGTKSSRERIEKLVAKGGGKGRAAPCDAKACLFLRLPPTEELAQALTLGSKATDPVRQVDQESEALYILAGRVASPSKGPIQVEYAWLMAALPARPGYPQAASVPLPRRTKWLAARADRATIAATAAEFEDRALRIARVRAWLAFEPSPDTGDFPYRLSVRKDGASAPLAPEAIVHNGEVLRFWLEADAARLAKDGSDQRYVYVLGIDSDAQITVLYSRDKVALDNRFPPEPSEGQAPQLPPKVRLGGDKDGVRVRAPFGGEVFVMLASRDPLPEIRFVEQKGVSRGRSETPRGASPLVNLLVGLGSVRGGEPVATGTAEWSIDRVTLTSAP